MTLRLWRHIHDTSSLWLKTSLGFMTVLFCIYDSSFDIYDTSWQKKKTFKNSSVALPRFVVVECFNLRCASLVLSHYTQRHHTTYSGIFRTLTLHSTAPHHLFRCRSSWLLAASASTIPLPLGSERAANTSYQLGASHLQICRSSCEQQRLRRHVWRGRLLIARSLVHAHRVVAAVADE